MKDREIIEAMARLEGMDNDTISRYIRHLSDAIGVKNCTEFDRIKAKYPQKVEAILKATGKWVKENSDDKPA
jgi:glutathionyl-hydroquinone reductase